MEYLCWVAMWKIFNFLIIFKLIDFIFMESKFMKSPFNSYDMEEGVVFTPKTVKLNAQYKTVADDSYTVNESESFFIDETSNSQNQNIAGICNMDSQCD